MDNSCIRRKMKAYLQKTIRRKEYAQEYSSCKRLGNFLHMQLIDVIFYFGF